MRWAPGAILLIVVGCVIVIYVPFIVWAYRYRRRDSAGP
jgi:hypothetical protein